MKNYYGSLCTEMYELLHAEAPQDELDFYLSYAQKGQEIFEPLCGSGRFLVPFLKRGFSIGGMDASAEMLAKLREKAPEAAVELADLAGYAPGRTYDYVFISSGSISLFTDMALCEDILRTVKGLLKPGGRFVFAADTVADRCPDNRDYKTAVAVKTREGYDLLLRNKDLYDEKSQTQFSPSVYELRDGDRLLQSETMDFQTHLYRFGEMEELLRRVGFTEIRTYSDYGKTPAVDDRTEMFLYECSF